MGRLIGMPKRPDRQASPAQRLKPYRAKRDFSRTPEPSGAATAATPAAQRRPRKRKDLFFCVQKHLASHLHYDFRLEHAGVLLSWAVPKGPSLNPKDKRLAMRTEDHPFDYGDFEGVIPEGYGAGIVMLWDRGTWHPVPGFEDVDGALKAGELKFELRGVKLKGSWVMVRTRNERTWLLIKHRDEWAGELDVIKAAPDSVKSFGDFAEILAAEKPDVWESHKPGGGASGRMLEQIIKRAARLRLARTTKRAGSAKKGRRTRTSRITSG
jgi:bifunctional non-homologous end joining protein LigD